MKLNPSFVGTVAAEQLCRLFVEMTTSDSMHIY